MLSTYKIYGLILTQASEAPPLGHTLVVSSINSIFFSANLKRPLKDLDWTSEPIDDFCHHQLTWWFEPDLEKV